MPTGGIRTHNPSKRAAVDRRLRPHGHCDRLYIFTESNLIIANLYKFEDSSLQGCHTEEHSLIPDVSMERTVLIFKRQGLLEVTFFAVTNPSQSPFFLKFSFQKY